MPAYRYEAMDNEGRTETGVVEAPTEGDAARQLRSQGLFVTRIELQDKSGAGAPAPHPLDNEEKAGCSIGVLVVLFLGGAFLCGAAAAARLWM